MLALSRSRPILPPLLNPLSLQASVAADRGEATTRGGSQLHQGQEPRTLGLNCCPPRPPPSGPAFSGARRGHFDPLSLLWFLQKPVQRAQAASHSRVTGTGPLHDLIQAPGARRVLQYFTFQLSIPSLKSKVLRRAFPSSVMRKFGMFQVSEHFGVGTLNLNLNLFKEATH